MAGYVHKPVRWDKEAATLWRAGLRDAALAKSLKSLEEASAPDADHFIQPGFYLFLLDRFDEAVAVLERGAGLFPDHPMILLSLGSAHNRARHHAQAIPWLERFLALGFADASAFDALASSHADTGDLIKAKLFGTMALDQKDKATADAAQPQEAARQEAAGDRLHLVRLPAALSARGVAERACGARPLSGLDLPLLCR
jgi:tetratricopeptide (TPR) repeat protein